MLLIKYLTSLVNQETVNCQSWSNWSSTQPKVYRKGNSSNYTA